MICTTWRHRLRACIQVSFPLRLIKFGRSRHTAKHYLFKQYAGKTIRKLISTGENREVDGHMPRDSVWSSRDGLWLRKRISVLPLSPCVSGRILYFLSPSLFLISLQRQSLVWSFGSRIWRAQKRDPITRVWGSSLTSAMPWSGSYGGAKPSWSWRHF